jgi:hypothetical protein
MTVRVPDTGAPIIRVADGPPGEVPLADVSDLWTDGASAEDGGNEKERGSPPGPALTDGAVHGL